MNTHYEELANAIILQAVKDYRDALKKSKNTARTRMPKIPSVNARPFSVPAGITP